MTYTFTLYINSYESGDRIYAEYHNFRKCSDGYVYYRGGNNHPLEISITERAAIDSMKKLFDVGWTCENDRILTVDI